MIRCPSISIALCTYNGEAFIAEQLASIAAQTRAPDEVVICDDGSRDRTLAIIDEFAGAAPFSVKVLRNEATLGSTGNFEQAISLCTGDLIALSDQDDMWAPNKLQTLADVMLEAPGAAGAFSDASIVDQHGNELGYTLWESIKFSSARINTFIRDDPFDVLAGGNVVTGAALMMRRRFTEIALPIPPRSLHDAWLAWMLCSQEKLIPVSLKLFDYRQHGSNQIGAKRATFIRKASEGRPQSRSLLFDALADEGRRILSRLESHGLLSDSRRGTLERRIRHYESRLGASENPARRPFIALRELVAGRYHRYSDGTSSFLGDLLTR